MSSEVHGPPILLTLALMVLALVYLRGWYRLRNALPNVLSVWRLAAFMGGLFSLWAAAGSPLAGMDHYLLTAHMAQHLLLMTVAAPLILLGAPAITLLHGIPQRFVLVRCDRFYDTRQCAGLDALLLTHCFVGSPPRPP